MPYICLTLKFWNNVGVWPVGFRYNHEYNNSKFGRQQKRAEWRPEEKKGKSSCKITWCTKCIGCMSCSRAWQFHNKDTSTWVFKLMMKVNVLKSPIKYSWHLIHTCIAETPTSGDLKSGDSLFFHYPPPPPPPPQNFNGSPPPHDPAPNGNDLGHFMKSYMKYILSNSQSSFWCQKESD